MKTHTAGAGRVQFFAQSMGFCYILTTKKRIEINALISSVPKVIFRHILC